MLYLVESTLFAEPKLIYQKGYKYMVLILMSAPQTVRKICRSKNLHGTQDSIFVFYL